MDYLISNQWKWVECSLGIKRVIPQNTQAHCYQSLESQKDMVFEKLTDLKPEFELAKKFTFQPTNGFSWHKSWYIPQINVRISSKTIQQARQDLQIRKLSCELTSAFPYKENGSFLLEEVPLEGQCEKMLSKKGQIAFSNLKFTETSFNKNRNKFSLVFIIYAHLEQPKQKVVLKSFISSPLHIDSRKQARKKVTVHHLMLEKFPIEKFDQPILDEEDIVKLGKKQNKVPSKLNIYSVAGFIKFYTAANIRSKIKHPYFMGYQFDEIFKVFYNKEQASTPIEALESIYKNQSANNKGLKEKKEKKKPNRNHNRREESLNRNGQKKSSKKTLMILIGGNNLMRMLQSQRNYQNESSIQEKYQRYGSNKNQSENNRQTKEESSSGKVECESGNVQEGSSLNFRGNKIQMTDQNEQDNLMKNAGEGSGSSGGSGTQMAIGSNNSMKNQKSGETTKTSANSKNQSGSGSRSGSNQNRSGSGSNENNSMDNAENHGLFERKQNEERNLHRMEVRNRVIGNISAGMEGSGSNLSNRSNSSFNSRRRIMRGASKKELLKRLESQVERIEKLFQNWKFSSFIKVRINDGVFSQTNENFSESTTENWQYIPREELKQSYIEFNEKLEENEKGDDLFESYVGNKTHRNYEQYEHHQVIELQRAKPSSVFLELKGGKQNSESLILVNSGNINRGHNDHLNNAKQPKGKPKQLPYQNREFQEQEAFYSD